VKEKTGLIILVIIGAIAIISVAIFSFLNIQLAPIYSLILSATLIAVTALYAYWTSQTVKAANRQAQIMLNAEYDAAKPVVKLEVEGRGQLKVTCENIGKGPALNLRCWVDDKEHPELQEVKVFGTAVAAGEQYVSFVSADIHTGIKDYTLRVGALIAHYESIFKRTYESSLLVSTNANPKLTFREVTENAMDKSSPSGAEINETQLDRIEKGIKRITLSGWRIALFSIGFATLMFSVNGLPVQASVRWALLLLGLLLVAVAPKYR
jgi:hypothetical protein